MRCNLKRNGGKTTLTDKKSGLQLLCDPHRSDRSLRVAFRNGFCYITGRSIGEHPPAFGAMLDAPFQYLSIGGGVDEGAPFIAQYRPSFPKPVLIDPAPIPVIAEMCEEAKKYEELDQYSEIHEFAQRCSIILDSSKVRLISTSLCRVDFGKEGLLDFADFAVDLCGPRHYAEWGTARTIPPERLEDCRALYDIGIPVGEIDAVERKLVKPGGRLYQAFCTEWDIEYRVYSRDDHLPQRKGTFSR